MIATFWAFAERLTPRVASAAISLIFAALAGPQNYGYYAAALLVYLGVQSATDSAIRQISVGVVQSKGGQRFLRRYRIFAGLFGTSASLLCILIFSLTFMPLNHAVALTPIALAPLAWSISVTALARNQLAGGWRAIAGAQAACTVVSCLAAAPLLLSDAPLLAPICQIALAELSFAICMVLQARRIPNRGEPELMLTAGERDSPNHWSSFRQAAQYSVLSWLQGQSDRLAISVIAGPAQLGKYSLAVSLSRNVADALSIGVVNVLRPQVLGDHGSVDVRDAARATISAIRRGVLLSVGIYIAALALSFGLPIILGPQWGTAAELVPVLALSALPALVAWSLTPLLVRTGKMRVGTIGKFVGLMLGIVAAITSPYSLAVTAWIIVLREIVVAAISAFALRGLVSLKDYSRPTYCILACAAISVGSSIMIGLLP